VQDSPASRRLNTRAPLPRQAALFHSHGDPQRNSKLDEFPPRERADAMGQQPLRSQDQLIAVDDRVVLQSLVDTHRDLRGPPIRVAVDGRTDHLVRPGVAQRLRAEGFPFPRGFRPGLGGVRPFTRPGIRPCLPWHLAHHWFQREASASLSMGHIRGAIVPPPVPNTQSPTPYRLPPTAYTPTLPPSTRRPRSSVRYWIASATWGGAMSTDSAKSAMVRAILRIR